MAADLLESLARQPRFKVQIHPGKGADFEASSSDPRTLISLLLRRQRERSGLSLAEAAQRLGAESRNAQARYERGTFVPTVEKLSELLRAITPETDLALEQSIVAHQTTWLP